MFIFPEDTNGEDGLQYCGVPGSPCLSKIGPVLVPFSFFGIPLARIHVLGPPLHGLKG